MPTTNSHFLSPLFSLTSLFYIVSAQQPNVGDQLATSLAGLVLNTLFPQLSNNNNNNAVRQQPSFLNVPALTAPKTDLSSSSSIFTGQGDGARAATLDLQSFPGGAPFGSNGLTGNRLSPTTLQLFPPPAPVSPGLLAAAANPSSPPSSAVGIWDQISRTGILPTLVNLAKPAVVRPTSAPIPNNNSPPEFPPLELLQNWQNWQNSHPTIPPASAPGGILPALPVNTANVQLNSASPLFLTGPSNATDPLRSAQISNAALLQHPQWPNLSAASSPASQLILPPLPPSDPPSSFVLPPQLPQVLNASVNSKSPTVAENADNFGSNCPQCIPIDLIRLAGPWVQVYGNPQALRNVFTSIAHLQSLYGEDSLQTTQFTAIQPSCVGVQFSKPQKQGRRSESTLNLFYRDDSTSKQLHETVGRVKQDLDSNPTSFIFKLPAFDLPVCLVKAGPETSTMYGYVILTETIGMNRCRSYHVFARQADSFFHDHNTEVATFLKTEVEQKSVKPVSILPFPDQCQLQNIAKIS